MGIHTFHILMVGAGDVGKTTYLTRITTGEYTFTYTPTVNTGYQTVYKQYIGNNSYVHFEVFESLNYIDGPWDAIIGMFDRTNLESFNYLIEQVKQFPNEIPVVYVGNKVDVKNTFMSGLAFRNLIADVFNLKKSMYFDLSAKSNFNYEKPFLVLARYLMKDPVLEFCYCPDKDYQLEIVS